VDSACYDAATIVRRDRFRSLSQVHLCIQILSAVSTVYRPITLEDLESFISIQYETLDNSQHDISWLEYYVRFCSSFLFIREPTIYFIHQSTKDFLYKLSLNTKFHTIFPYEIEELGAGQSRHIKVEWNQLANDRMYIFHSREYIFIRSPRPSLVRTNPN